MTRLKHIFERICDRKCQVALLWLAGLVGVGLAIYLSVRPSPALTTVGWLPKWLSLWLDQHGQFRNFPAFAVLALPFLLVAPSFLRRAGVIVVLALLVDALELLQLNINSRFADLWDIVWGWAGLLSAWAVFEVACRFRQNRRRLNAAGAAPGRQLKRFGLIGGLAVWLGAIFDSLWILCL